MVASFWINILQCLSAVGQLTVDATGPNTFKKLREPDTGRGGGPGRRVPVQVAMGSTGAPTDENGKTMIEFILTNSGKANLEITDLSPSPRFRTSRHQSHLHRSNSGSVYHVKQRPNPICLRVGFSLYGNDGIPGTLMRLTSGQSLRVIVRVAIPSASAESQSGEVVLVGHVKISGRRQSRMFNDQIRGDTREIRLSIILGISS